MNFRIPIGQSFRQPDKGDNRAQAMLRMHKIVIADLEAAAAIP